MYKCILWGTGKVFYQNINIVKYHELLNSFEVVGVTSNTTVFVKVVDWPFVNKEELNNLCFDFVIVMADKTLGEIVAEAMEMGISTDRIISYKALTIRGGGNIEKFLNIKKNPPSIFSNNCWGGLIYNSLGLQFLSPFINMSVNDDDYIKFLRKPQAYLQEKLRYEGEGCNEKKKMNYPIGACGDIRLHFIHYESFDTANLCWEKRKERINWENLFVMMYTENKHIAKIFTELPYHKKICFVPFETDEPSLCFIDFRNKNEMANKPFWHIVNGTASGVYPWYSTIDLICECKINRLSI